MKTLSRVIAAAELALVAPAAVFITALMVRNFQPPPYEPAQTARHIVEWFAAHPPLGLQLFLMAMPLAAMVVGGASLLYEWNSDAELRLATRAAFAAVRAHLASLLIAVATVIASGTLFTVFLHMAAD